MKNILFIFLLITLFSCRKSKWEETLGNGIPDGETVDNAIYFQDSLNGIVGGHKFIENVDSDNLETIPVLYLTKNGGKDWKLIEFHNEIKGGVNNVSFSGDTITCIIDSVFLKSNNSGLNWKIEEKSNYKDLNKKYFSNANHFVLNRKFVFENKKYDIKESYKYKNVEVIICYGEKAMTDYYFISKNNGVKWAFLQEDFGSNKSKYLLKDEYLISYNSQYGLQKLKLK